jgi:molecular chaperone DnaK (HSP70)
MSQPECIVGIDLGTTFSEVAAFTGGRVRVLGPEGGQLLPSCVGFSLDGQLLVGAPARNQFLIYPERTVRSIKRKMGSDEKVPLGDRTFSPQEVSALILRQLAAWAEAALGGPVRRAVITVPAYFSDAQRNATREAGELAGLEVVRILNEPTAAALAYGGDEEAARTVMVYDLGGGTFDVSIVRIERDVTEVLASHGNNQLGGDDFDQLVIERLLEEFKAQHGLDLRDEHPAAYSRLWLAAEEAKKTLSYEPYARVREEALLTVDGKPLHLDVELSRADYEHMIRPLVESTLDSVSRALDDAAMHHRDLDAILLVGGSTRTPLVAEVLEQRTGMAPRRDMHPDLCVALGAGLLASRLGGQQVERVLVDVSPFSFGPSYLGEKDGRPYPHCYHPVIKRNTPLPITRTESYGTSYPYQDTVDVFIYQGEDPDALKDILVGQFTITGLRPKPDQIEVLCRMQLDLDGILRVSAIEKETGKAKHITIAGALEPKTRTELAAAQHSLEDLFRSRLRGDDAGIEAAEAEEEDVAEGEPEADRVAGTAPEPAGEGEAEPAVQDALALLERSRSLLDTMHDEDKEEAVDLHEQIQAAIAARDLAALAKVVEELRELLFFVEGR